MHWNRNDHSCLTLCSTWQNWHQWRTQEQLVPLGLPRLLSHSDGWTSCWRCAPRNKEKEESTETGHCHRFAAAAGRWPSGAVYWPYCTSIGYLRLSTVCSEPLVAGPPQWKCSWMVWYTSGRPPPLTDMPLPTCSRTGGDGKHVVTNTNMQKGRLWEHLWRIHQSVHRSEASSGPFGSRRSPPDVKVPETRSWPSGRPDWWESDALQVRGDKMGTCLPMRKDLRTVKEQKEEQVHQWKTN